MDEHNEICRVGLTESGKALDCRLRKLTYDDVVDWMGDRYAARAWNYREKVLDFYAMEEGFVGNVRGSEIYTTKLTADSCGKFVSVCTCPLGGDCKHAGALAFVVSERLKCDGEIPVGVSKTMLDNLASARDRPRGDFRKAKVQAERFDPYAPIPRNGPDFARVHDGDPISFPNNRFRTNLWPNLHCRTPTEVRDALSKFRLEGRVLEQVHLFGRSYTSDEKNILYETGFDEGCDFEGVRLKRAYAQLPLGRKIGRQVETDRVICVRFRSGGSFEVDGERAPDFYLAMNQIGYGTRPERPVNVDGRVLFAPICGHKIVGVEVETSQHASDPYSFSANHQLLQDVERWSEKAIGPDGRMRMLVESY